MGRRTDCSFHRASQIGMESTSVEELKALLDDAGLEHYLEKASAWCIEQGARFVYEIDENKDDFAEALAFKRLEKVRLEKALIRAAASPDLSEHVQVKNAPAAGRARDVSEGEEEEEMEEAEVDADQPESPRGVADLACNKTMTVFDDESVIGWGRVDGGGFVHGDPNVAVVDAGTGEAPEAVDAPLAVAPWAMCVPMGFVPVDPGSCWAHEDSTLSAPSPTSPPQRDAILQRVFSCSSLVYRIRWTVDSRKLKRSDREAVSPIFELSFAGPVEFSMILKPRAVDDAFRGASFKKAQGWGSIELKCRGDVDTLTNPVLTFRLGVGSHSNPKKQQRFRGPVTHDFRDRPICGLEGMNEWWDFQRSVDKQRQSFVVCLEVFPSGV